MTIDKVIAAVHDAIWGVPLILLIMVCGIMLTLKLKGVQVRHLGLALKYMVSNENDDDTGKVSGEVTSFAALCTALSATIGTGNIVGVATAIAAGGSGALFWMELAAIFGMATKYAEGFLAIKYRVTDKEGHMLGGPFYYIENGMGQRWKWLGKLFAFFGLCAGVMGIGTITQINGISSAANNFFNSEKTVELFGKDYSLVTVISGLIVTLCAALVIIGGIKSISKVSEIIVPFMAIAYVLCVLIIIITHITEIPSALAQIIGGAFGFRPIAGAAAGQTIIFAMQKGIARGIFSNEAGLGSAPIAAAAARTKEPVRQGLVTMTGTFIDTICICTMTGLSIVISGAWSDPDLEGVEITAKAFGYGLPFSERVSSCILMICLIFFAFTTILGWSYYAERCLSYLVGSSKTVTRVFRIVYILAVFAGPYLTVEAVWNIADIFNGLMALPNVTALIMLSGVTAKDTAYYFKRLKHKPIIAE